ncbi:MAG: hypothetical protein Q8891_01265 [Bacteroidota bacterium]|nr:hypothetical protein [Bacteroidota bacterium]
MTNCIFRFSVCSFVFALFASNSANAQYYYKDILSNQQLNKEFFILKNKQIKDIKIKSFEGNDEPSEGFFCEKKINKGYSQSEMLSKSNITGQSLLVTDYNAKGLVIETTNTTPTSSNIVKFDYDDQGHLSMITTETTGGDDSSGIVETHQYFYDKNGNLEKMLRKKNNVLIATITFVKDGKGNVIEEDAAGKSNDKKYYYYYDDKNRLTDVVHFNEVARKLLPDYMFEYDTLNQKKQMISVDESGRNYFIWRYAYNDQELPEIQKCFSKEKKLLGTIQYEYY